MKKLNIMRCSIAALCLILFIGALVAVAATLKPGSAEDPLISKGYISDTYIPNALKEMASRAAEKTQPILTQVETGLGSSGQSIATFAKGDALQLYTGGSLMIVSGSAAVDKISGTLVDATQGKECKAGDAIVLYHRYLVAEDSTITVNITSASAQGFMITSTPSEETLPFQDVKATDWYYTYIQYVYEEKLFNGTGENTFSPNGEMNRAMLATVIYRLDGGGETGFANPFTDVQMGEWYTNGVTWAADMGIVKGMSAYTFSPEIAVTREQIAVMLYRYAGDSLELDVSASGDLTAFKDAKNISSWAEDSVSWAVDKGILSGMGDGTLAPNATATRAEVAAMLQRFSTLIA
jgi:hypothetical protein